MITHRPKGSMCINCKSFRWQLTGESPCPEVGEFGEMRPIGKDDDGAIVVRCDKFIRDGE